MPEGDEARRLAVTREIFCALDAAQSALELARLSPALPVCERELVSCAKSQLVRVEAGLRTVSR